MSRRTALVWLLTALPASFALAPGKAAAHPAGPSIRSVDLTAVRRGTKAVPIHMGYLGHDVASYLLVRVPRVRTAPPVSAKVVDESLASCEVVGIHSTTSDSLAPVADIVVSFEAAHEGDFDSCRVEVKNGGTAPLLVEPSATLADDPVE